MLTLLCCVTGSSAVEYAKRGAVHILKSFFILTTEILLKLVNLASTQVFLQ